MCCWDMPGGEAEREAQGLAAAGARRRWERASIGLGVVVVCAGLGGEASHRVCLRLSAVPFHLLLFDSQRVRMQ